MCCSMYDVLLASVSGARFFFGYWLFAIGYLFLRGWYGLDSQSQLANSQWSDISRITHHASRITFHVSARLRRLPIGSRTIQINQYIPRLGAFAGADDAAVFQLVHNAGGAAIADAQSPLQKRHAGFLFAANDFA